MIRIANAQFWVHDQDDALRFYTKMLGWEVRADVTMDAWNFRWLSVGPGGQDDVGFERCSGRVGGEGGRRDIVPRNQRLPSELRRVIGSGYPVQRSAGQAALRDRHFLPGPLRKQHPPYPGPGFRSESQQLSAR